MMKTFLPIAIITVSFFVSNISFAVRTFTKDGAEMSQQEPVLQTNVKNNDKTIQKPVENLPNIKEQEEENKEIFSDSEENIKEDIEKLEIPANERLENTDDQAVKDTEESREVEEINTKKKVNENVVKPQISGSGDYKTF